MMSRHLNNPVSAKSVFVLAILYLILANFGYARAGGGDDPFAGMVPISDAQLKELRGGFITADGLEINIGYEQVSYINGILESHTAIDLSQLDRAGMNGAIDNALQTSSLNIIQNGPGNRLPQGLAANIPDGFLTVIQNTLDGQTINNINLLNIRARKLGGAQSTALGNMIDLQLSSSLR